MPPDHARPPPPYRLRLVPGAVRVYAALCRMRSAVPGAGAAPLSGAILVAVPAMGTTVGAQRTPLPPSGEGLRIMTTMSGLLMGYPTPYGRGLGLREIFGRWSALARP